MFKPTLKLTGVSKVGDLRKSLAKLESLQVYVGIPQDKISRRGDVANNAELLYIFTNGSPIRNQPPRGVIEPAILDDRANIAAELKDAAEGALEGDQGRVISGLKRAGIEGQNAARGWFTNPKNNWAPNAPATIAAKGSDQPGIDTAQMRNSIVYVVAEE